MSHLKCIKRGYEVKCEPYFACTRVVSRLIMKDNDSNDSKENVIAVIGKVLSPVNVVSFHLKR